MVDDIAGQRHRIAARDRPWVSSVVSVICGPFDMPSVEELRGAVDRLALAFPRAYWRPDSGGSHWIADRSADQIVAERDWDGVEVGSVLDDIVADPGLGLPLTVIRYPRHIGLKMSHGLGDGQSFLLVPAAVLLTAHTGEPPPWPLRQTHGFPLAEAAWRTFGRRPGLIRAAVGDRTVVPVDPTAEHRQAFTPARTTVHVSLDAERAAALYEWGTTCFPSASRFALQVALILKAMQATGFEVSPDVRVVVDLRRYLAWRPIDGNFLAGVPVAVDADMSPAAVSQCIAGTTRSGRPLAGQLLTALRRPSAPAPVREFDPAQPARMTFSNLGRIPQIEALPYLPDQQLVYGGSVDPDGPHGITVLMGENSGTLTIDLVFHRTVTSAEKITRAMDLLSADPVGVLNRAVGSP